MKKNNYLYLLLIILACADISNAQVEQKIRFKKEQGFIYFFQKDQYSDTIKTGKGEVFYLIVPDSIKPFISIQVDNAQLLKTENDSLVKINYVKGFNYESLFIASEPDKRKRKNFEFRTLVNGVSALAPDRIEIKFIDKREKNVLLKNMFYFSSKN